jgi:hypothetical protein
MTRDTLQNDQFREEDSTRMTGGSMLGDDRWFAIPDDTVTRWCLLVIDTTTSDGVTHIAEWHVATANTRQLLQTYSDDIDSCDSEAELLENLLAELNPLRRGNCILITWSSHHLSLLRTRLLMNDIEGATLRGFNYIPMVELLDRYFAVEDGCSIEYSQTEFPETDLPFNNDGLLNNRSSEFTNPTSTLYSTFIQLGALLPRNALDGTPV